MATEEAVPKPEVGKDDRWSAFIDPNHNSNLGVRKKNEPLPQLNDFLGKVLLQRSPAARQERKYRVASTLVRHVTDFALVHSAQWKAYTNTDNRIGVKTTPLRTLSEDKYDCMVPLIRPMRLDAFKIVQRGIDEMPQHRCLIQVNPALCREEQQLVRNQWDSYINKKGYLKPRAVLSWFNTGLSQGCASLKKESHNVDKLICTVGEDGTATMHATTTEFVEGELFIDNFTVNIFPVFVIDKLPSSLKLTAPLPCFGPYIHGQKAFRELVLNDLEAGKQIAFLDPKGEPSTGAIKGGLPREGPSWKLNLSFTEYHVYSLIDKYCRGLNFRHVLILLNILREQNPDKLKILNNDILINTLFGVSQKFIDKLSSKQDWVYKMLATLSEDLRIGFLPSFHLPRLNLLSVYGVSKEESQNAAQAIRDILEALRENPKTIYDFTGYEDKKGDKSDDDDDDEDGDDDDERDNGDNNKENEVRVEDKEKMMDNKPEPPTEEDKGTGKVASDLEAESSRLYSCLMVEEESGISKFSKKAERSDIY